MHTLEVFGTDPRRPTEAVQYTFPGSWEECSVQQLGTVAALTSTVWAEDPELRERQEAHARLHLLRSLSGIPEASFERILAEDLLALRPDELQVDRVAFLPQLDWCFADPWWPTSIVPTVKVGRTTWTGPADRLANFTLKRWGFADALTAQLAGQQVGPETLNNLLGALYHPEGTTWNNQDIEARGRELAALPDTTKLAAVVNYRGLRAALRSQYARCFRGGKADPHGLQGMIVRMAGPKFGTVQQAEDAPLHAVLTHVDQSLQDAEEAKQRRS